MTRHDVPFRALIQGELISVFDPSISLNFCSSVDSFHSVLRNYSRFHKRSTQGR